MSSTNKDRTGGNDRTMKADPREVLYGVGADSRRA